MTDEWTQPHNFDPGDPPEEDWCEDYPEKDERIEKLLDACKHWRERTDEAEKRIAELEQKLAYAEVGSDKHDEALIAAERERVLREVRSVAGKRNEVYIIDAEWLDAKLRGEG